MGVCILFSIGGAKLLFGWATGLPKIILAPPQPAPLKNQNHPVNFLYIYI